MDKSITQLGQDLALAKYAKTTRKSYVRTAEHLSGRFKRPLTHRVGIANSRLLAVSAEAITFRTKGTGTETLAPVVFLRRFVQHVLPDHLHKIRHVGLYASASAGQNDLARRCLRDARPLAPSETWRERLVRLTGRDLSVCPRCAGRVVALSLPLARAPPPGVGP